MVPRESCGDCFDNGEQLLVMALRAEPLQGRFPGGRRLPKHEACVRVHGVAAVRDTSGDPRPLRVGQDSSRNALDLYCFCDINTDKKRNPIAV